MSPSAELTTTETLAELHYTASRWDDTMPGRFYDRVLPLGFALRPSIQPTTLVRDEAPTAERYGARSSSSPLLRFDREDDHAALQLERDLLVVNQLAPVPTLDRWLPTIETAARIYADLAAPRGCTQLRLRTIQRLELPSLDLALPDYFEIGPRFPATWREAQHPFALRIERRLAADLHLLLTLGSGPKSSPDRAPFVLDLCAIHTADHPLTPTELAAPLRRAHAALEETSESALTPKLRALLARPKTP